MPVCSIDAPAVSGVVLELWLGHSSRTTPLTAGASIEHTDFSEILPPSSRQAIIHLVSSW